MKKVFTVLLVLVMVLSMVSVVNAEGEPEGLYLTTITAESAVGYIPPIIDTEGTIRVADGDLKFPHSIEAHPISDTEPSYVVYNIEAYNYTHFSAYLGKNADLGAAGAHVVFVVWADDEEIYRSEAVAVGDEPVACVVAIPTGTKKLTLEVNAGTDGVGYDTSTWGTPMLSNVTVTELKESRKVSKTQYFVGDTLSVSGGFYAIKYSNGMEATGMLEESMVTGFDSSTPGTKTLTVTYQGKSYTFDVTVSEKTTPTPESQATPTPAKTNGSGTSTDDGNSNSVFIIIGIVAAVVVIIIVIALIAMNKKKKNA